jgi:NLR family CARD domain-containing protein 3
MKSLAASLKVNTSLKWLNLYRNLIDVDGARAIAECLKVNKTLEFVDLGFNRVRDTGLKAITDALSANIESSVVKLAIRANFITDQGLEYLFRKIVLV